MADYVPERDDAPSVRAHERWVGFAHLGQTVIERLLRDGDDDARCDARASSLPAAGLLADAPGAEVYAWREWGDPDQVISEDSAFDRQRQRKKKSVIFLVIYLFIM